MIEKIDINEVERNLPSTNSVDYLRGLKDMNSVLINPYTLLSSSIAMINIAFSKGDNLNDLKKDGVYSTYITEIANSLVNAPGDRHGECAMLYIKNGGYGVQIYFNITHRSIYFRFNRTTTWSIWESISLT